MTTKTSNVKVMGALERLKNVNQAAASQQVSPESEPAVADANDVVTTKVSAVEPSKPTRVSKPIKDVAAKADMLRDAPTKRPTYMQEKPYAKMGRPTQKQGDLKTDYVKISPAIPRNIKDRLDDALPGLRRDPAAGVLTMEDVVTKALDAYLTARGR
jgi:hypothetical protein